MPNTASIETILGFDFGLKRIGVAVGQTITNSANPVGTILAKNGEPDWAEMDALFARWRPQAIIVGRPVRMSGEEQPITHASDTFALSLEKRYDLPVFRVDERLTSAMAKQVLIHQEQTKKPIKPQLDAMSAKILCELWLRR